MKKLLLFSAVLVFFGSINAQEFRTRNEMNTKSFQNRGKIERTTQQNLVITNSVGTPSKIAPAPAAGMANVTLTAGDIWGDGTGYQLLLDATATQYGITIPAEGNVSTSCSVSASLYDVFAYKIPTNADPSCTTANIVINNSITIQVPAGTYDYCIANPVPSDKIYIAGGTKARGNDLVIEEGKEYTFTVTATGTGGDNVTLKITGGEPCDPITSFPWTESFSSGEPNCWDVLGGDDTFGYSWDFGPLSDNGVAASFSYITDWETYGYEVTPDNWLVTPQLVINSANYNLSFKIKELEEDPDYALDKYSVLVSKTGKEIGNFEEIHTETLTVGDFKTVTLSLNSYAGQSIYIAFRHWGCIGMYAVALDDVKVSATTSSIPVVNSNEINIFQNNNNIFVTPSENSDVRVLDVLGKVLGSYNVAANATLTVNQPSGIYLIEVRSNGNVSTHKVVVK